MDYYNDYFKDLNVQSTKEADPNEYIELISHSIRLGAINKAKFMVWIANNSYELLEQDDESIKYLLSESLSVFKKYQKDLEESGVDFLDSTFYAMFKMTDLFKSSDCISLSLVLLSYISYKSNYLEEEVYLEIRDWMVPFNLMISQCKVKPEDMMENYKKITAGRKENVKLLAKLGKGIEVPLPDNSLILEALKEITYDKESWEKE